MAVILVESDDSLKNEIPNSLTQIDISELTVDTNGKEHFVMGEVCVVWPVQRTTKSSLLKICIKQGEHKINVFLHNSFAENCKNIHTKDKIALGCVFIEANTGYQTPTSHDCQIVVDVKLSSPSVWLVHKNQNEKSQEKAAPDQTIQSQNVISKPTKHRKYVYTALNDLKQGAVVNVYGVVKYIRAPWKTRGTDWAMMVSLVDPSLDLTKQEKFKCMIFSRDETSLPKLELGQVLRLHRVKINMYQGQPQGGNAPGFSWLAVSGAVNASMEPVVVSSSFVFTDEDADKVRQLRQWTSDTSLSPVSSQQDVQNTAKTISQVKTGDYFDLVCQVCGVSVVVPGKQVVLRVWDGTKPAQLFYKIEDGEAVMSGNKRLMTLVREYLVDIWVFDNHAATVTNIKAGDIIKVTNLHVNRPKAIDRSEITLHGGYSYGRKIQKQTACEERDELEKRLDEVTEVIDSSSSLSPAAAAAAITSSPTPPNANLLSSFDLSSHHGGLIQDIPSTSSVDLVQLMDVGNDVTCMRRTRTVLHRHHHQPCSLISAILSRSPPHKFRVQANVVGVEPGVERIQDAMQLGCTQCKFLTKLPSSEELDNPSSWWHAAAITQLGSSQVPLFSCPVCEKTSDNPSTSHALVYVYVMQLILVDSEGWLVAGLYGDDAETFFGASPVDLLGNKERSASALSALRALSPRGSNNRVPVDCCIKSFTSPNGTRYRIFNTELVFPSNSNDV